MTRVEWGETTEYQPINSNFMAFIKENRIRLGDIPKEEILIFVERQALEGLNDFLSHDLSREHGGVLLGNSYFDNELNQKFIVIQSAIPAQDTIGSAVHLQFTSEAWAYISGIIEESHRGKIVVGWYHSHPGLGIFMSSTDRASQEAFFYHDWNLAIVVDPTCRRTGWFIGKDCKNVNPSCVFLYDQIISTDEGTTSKVLWGGEKEYAEETMKKIDWLLPFLMVSMLLVYGLIGFFFRWRNHNY